MATLTVSDIVETGISDSLLTAAAGGGDVFKNASGDRNFLWIRNGSGGSITVTATAQKTSKNIAGFGEMDRNDIVVAVPAGEDKLIGPFAAAFNSTSGQVALTYSGVTSVTVAPIRLPPQ